MEAKPAAVGFNGYDGSSEVGAEGTNFPQGNLSSPQVFGVKSTLAEEMQP